MRKLLIGFSGLALMAAGMAIPAASFAQTATTTTSSSIQAQLSLIASLSAQIKALQQQLAGLVQQQQTATTQLVSSLSLGSQGDQVKVLQALLAADPSIYPQGLVTGYFGPATAQAVKRYQKAHGLDQVGRVGPQTLESLNKDLDENPVAFENGSSTATSSLMNGEDQNGQGNDHGQGRGEGRGRLCAIVPPGHLIAPGWLRHNGGEVPVIPTCQTLPPGIQNILNGSSSVPTPTPTSTVDTTAPVISSTTVTAASTTATVSWMTNENATGKVFYGTANPVDLTSTSTLTASNNSLGMSHSFALTGLTASTTYYYVLQSVDGSGNTATAAQASFTTAAQ